MKIGIDIDGVLTDIEQWQLDIRFLTDKDNENGKRMKKTVTNWLNKYNIYYDKIIFIMIVLYLGDFLV